MQDKPTLKMLENPRIPLVFLLLFSCFVVYTYIIHPTFLSPLSRIPNANISVPFSPLWILWKRWSSKEVSAIHAAHERYGPIVRLGPKEISVNSSEGLRVVYAGGYEKHEFYANSFDNYGVSNMFSTVHSKPHANRKRMLAHVYSKSFLQSSAPSEAQSRIIIHSRLLPKLRRLADDSPDKSVEVHALTNALTMDFTTAYLFGLANSSDFLRNDEKSKWQMRLFHCRRPSAFWAAELPGVVTFLSRLGLGECVAPKFASDATRALEDWGLEMLDGAEALLSNASDMKVEDTPVVYMQLRSALTQDDADTKKPSESTIPVHNPRLSLASEMLDHLGAGQETSGITLTYALWELAHNPKIQTALREEILGLSPRLRQTPTISTTTNSSTTLPTLPSAKDIAALPLLDAVLTETLRLHAAIPGPEPRVTPYPRTLITPATKKQPSGGVENLLSALPGGIRISSQPYTLHRLTSIFPEPETWNPSRWLLTTSTTTTTNQDDEAEEESARRRAMSRHFWAFGSGGRMCIGSNLATQTMKLTIASVVANFVILPIEEEEEEVDGVGKGKGGGGGKQQRMEQEDAYVAQPRGMRCMLRFEKIDLLID